MVQASVQHLLAEINASDMVQIRVQQGLDYFYPWIVVITVIRGVLIISGDYKQSVSQEF